MKFVLATLAILVLSGLICLGLLLAATGHGLLPIVAVVALFLGMFIRFGCLAH